MTHHHKHLQTFGSGGHQARAPSRSRIAAALALALLLNVHSTAAETDAERMARQAQAQLPRATAPASPPNSQPATRPVLVIDFIGWRDANPGGHAAELIKNVLPEASSFNIGFHGTTPDAKRDGYSIIVPYKTASQKAQAAEDIYKLTAANPRTVLAFDFNEAGLPNQLRAGLFNKIAGPAEVAASTAARWSAEHPGGAILLVGHSDGTYAVRDTYDRLVKAGVRPEALILQSPRAPYATFGNRAANAPETKVISITSRADLPRTTLGLFDPGYDTTKTDNRINYHLKDTLNPANAHGAVTKLGAVHPIRRADSKETSDYSALTLGQLLANDLSGIVISNRRAAPPPSSGTQAPVAMPSSPRYQPALPDPAPPQLRTRRDDAPSGPMPQAGLLGSPPPPPPPPPGGGATRPLGGVDLDTRSVRIDPRVAPITAVVIEPRTGAVILLSETGPRTAAAVDPSLFALGLWLARTGQQAAMSLDPLDPAHPDGKWMKAVYWPEALGSQRAGKLAFDADFLLKQTAFCVRVKDDGEVVEWASRTGLKCLPDLMRANPEASREPSWARMWIVAEEIVLSGGDGAVRATVRMGVRARKQVPDKSARTGLRDVDTDPASHEASFAKEFSRLYPEVEKETPQFAIGPLYEAIALARWVVDQGAAVDMQAVVALLNQDRVAGVGKVTALNVVSRSQTRQAQADGGTLISTREIRIFGGVDLAAKAVSRPATEMTQLQRVVVERLAVEARPQFAVEFGGRTFQATRLAYTGSPSVGSLATSSTAGRRP